MKVIVAFLLILVPSVFCFELISPYHNTSTLVARAIPDPVCADQGKLPCSSNPEDFNSICCGESETCCQVGDSYTSCAPSGGKCCTDGHSCSIGEECCGSACMPEGSVCCDDSFCPAASLCPDSPSKDKCSGAEKLYGISVLVIFAIYFVIFM